MLKMLFRYRLYQTKTLYNNGQVARRLYLVIADYDRPGVKTVFVNYIPPCRAARPCHTKKEYLLFFVFYQAQVSTL